MDLGAGDGRWAAARATACPDGLVIAVDASGAAMAEASRRAFRQRRTNLLFLAADVRNLPPALEGIADELAVSFPWGTLLDAVATADQAVVRLLRPGGVMRVLVSAAERDARGGLVALDPARLERSYVGAGLELAVSRPASIDDAVAARSSWGKRLLRSRGSGRTAWLLEARRPCRPASRPVGAAGPRSACS